MTTGMFEGDRVDQRVASRLRRASAGLCLLALAIAAVTLARWILRGGGLLEPAPHTMANTAIAIGALALGGLSARRGRGRVATALTVFGAAIAATSAVEMMLSVDLGIDQALFDDPSRAGVPGRMGLNTAAALMMLAGATWARRTGLAQTLSLGAGIVALLTLIGYASGVDELTGTAGLTRMAAPTAVAILALSLAQLVAHPEAGPMRVLSAGGSAGDLARKLVPAVVALPLAAAFGVSAGASAGLWDRAGAEWLLLMMIIGTFVACALRLAMTIERVERVREESRERTENFFELSHDMLCTVGPDRRFAELNESWSRVLGYELDELRARPAIEFVHPDDRERTRRLSREALAMPPGGVVLENRYATKAGGWRWLSWSIRLGHDGEYLYGRATDVTERKLAEDRLTHLARHDGLTGLANRHNFDERLAGHLAHASRYGWRGAVLAVDLDGLKEVNDAYGHAAGDALLRSAARRMREGLRGSDLLARLGGDEFVVLLPEAGRAEAEVVAAKLVGLLAEGGGALPAPAASIGVAVIEGATDGEDLLAAADRALYDAKRAGGATSRTAPATGRPAAWSVA